jgi:hypothetical protein
VGLLGLAPQAIQQGVELIEVGVMDDQTAFALFARRSKLDAEAELRGQVLLKIAQMRGRIGFSGGRGRGDVLHQPLEISDAKPLPDDAIG